MGCFGKKTCEPYHEYKKECLYKKLIIGKPSDSRFSNGSILFEVTS